MYAYPHFIKALTESAVLQDITDSLAFGFIFDAQFRKIATVQQ